MHANYIYRKKKKKKKEEKKNNEKRMEKQSNREIDMEEVRKVFARFDANGDGKISPSELGDAVRAALGAPDMSDEEVQAMLREMDSDRDGFVDLGEFADFHRIRGKEEEELREAFDLYDDNGDGLVSAAELHMVLEKLGEKCTVGDCEKMIASVDSDGDRFVDFHEFKKMMGIEGGAGGGAGAGNADGGAATAADH